MKRLLNLSCVSIFALALAAPVHAQEPPPRTVAAPRETAQKPVPIEQASYHVPVFSNDLVTVLRVYIPPGRASDYHIHSLDQISVVIEDHPPDAYSQKLGEARGTIRSPRAGETGYSSNSPPLTHRGVNPGKTLPMHLIVLLLRKPSGFTAAARNVHGYTQVFDNARARAWRLVLQPGETAPAITQHAPGIRVIVGGDGEITEISPGARDRAMYLRKGDFYWQDPGKTRAVRNIGSTRLELVEVEFK
jgi:mannose-6-phosphate isomerase-like protein (cupin superfamily)